MSKLNPTLRDAKIRGAGKRSYAAAKIDRLTSDWIFSPLSANKEVESGLETIRNRARELERDNDFVRKYLAMVEANIVGRGFQLRVEGVENGQSIAKKFLDWFDFADVTGKLSGPDLQRLIARTVARDGECAVQLFKNSSLPDGLGIKVIEADFIDHRVNQSEVSGQNRIVMGVEIDRFGRNVAYYMHKEHPGDGSIYGGQRERISASNLLFVNRIERPGQVRSVSWMASSMAALRMLYGYMEAELVAARVSSCKMGFYKIPPGEDFTGDGIGDNDTCLSDATPGVFERMPTGWEFQSFDPAHPTAQFGDFVKAILRQLAGGLNVSYNNFAGDLSDVNYSSIRAGTIEEREHWKVSQEWFSRAFLTPLFFAWLDMATLTGTVDIMDAEAARPKFTGRRWSWVDPLKDIKAKQEELSLGLTAPSRMCAENGEDFEQIQRELAEDEAIRESLGLPSLLSSKNTQLEKNHIVKGEEDGQDTNQKN